jgi:hypothetical protein
MLFRIEPGAEPIAGHRLLARLGRGGFGEVWKCTAPDGSLRAIKLVYGDLAAASAAGRTAEQELRALRLVAALRHPSLLAPERYDVGDGKLAIVMPLADGNLWDEYQACRGRGRAGIPRESLLGYFADVADGLDHLRRNHLQHLDVKPQNLFRIANRGAVGDFGLVRDIRSEKAGAGATPTYAAPETFGAALSPHADQYSLAVVYQELLTGVRPFAGATPEQLAHQHLTVEPNLSPLPPADRPAVARALAKNPAERFPSCAEFVRALVDPTAAAGPSIASSSLLTPLTSLRPAVVLGVGGVGGAVLGRLARALAERGDSPHLRLLYIDTDADAIRAAVESGLNPAAALPVPLQRAGDYAQRRPDPRASGTIGWYDPNWFKRLTASQTPAGCRGLGRIAFADHIRALAQKIEADLSAVTRGSTGRPRVVVVAGLAGGTGSGMAIDLAYLARHLLRRFGDPADVAGWLLLPGADADDRAAANAYAALAELRHFCKPDTTYRARCDDPEGSLATRDAPFGDTIVLPADSATTAEALADELLASDRPAARGAGCRTFGHARLVWPRRAILGRAARRLTAALLERWTAVDDTAIVAPVRAWVGEQWSALGLAPEPLAKRFEQAAAAAIGGPATEVFTAIVGPAALLRPDAVPDVKARLDHVLGRYEAALAAATSGLVAEWGTRLARPAAALIEHPDFRLAGAEVAVRLLTEAVARSLSHVSPAADEWLRKADVARKASGAEAVQTFPRCRYQGLLLRQVAAVYTALRPQMADQVGEVALCRTRLTAALENLRRPLADPSPTGLLLPPGCTTVAEAADRIAIGADDVRELDRRAQQYLQDSTGGLARLCLTATDLSRTLAPTLVEMAEAVLAPRLGENGAAESFLASGLTDDRLQDMWTAAAPPIAGADEVTTVTAPEQLADLARQAFGPDTPVTTSADEVAVVRTVRVPLAGLAHLGPEAKAAFQRRKAAGEVAHARIDVIFGD